MKTTRVLVCFTAGIATFVICSAALAEKEKIDLTPDNFKSQGFTVITSKGDGEMVSVKITRDLSKARTFPADSEIRLVRRAELEVIGPAGSIATCNLEAEEDADTVRYSFTIARDFLAHSLVRVSEIDDYKKGLNREHLVGGGTYFYIKLSDLPKP